MPKRKTDRDGLYKQKRSPYWWASYTDANGRRVRRSTGTDSHHEAQAMLAGWKVEMRQERAARKCTEYTLHALVVAYIEAHGDKRSLPRDAYSIKHLYRFLSPQASLTSLKRVDVHSYVQMRQHEGAKADTVNREIGFLSAAINWARKILGWDIPNPAEGSAVKRPPGRDRWLSELEAARLLDAARGSRAAAYLPDFILIALHTGMRTGEILKLEWQRVDLIRGWIRLGASHQKSGKPGSVPLNQTAREALLSRARFRATHCPASPWVFCDRQGNRIASIDKGFESARQRAGIAHCVPHDLRRTCGSWLVQAGVPLHQVARLLRHADIRVTEQVYAHLLPEQLQMAVQILDRHTVRHTPVEETGSGDAGVR